MDRARYMFTFGEPAGSGSAPPLACIAGGLIVDSGEEDLSFVFRCQDRYPVYTALAGLRTVLFVLDEAHVEAYDVCLDDLQRRLDLVKSRTGVLESLTLLPPLYIGYEPVTGRAHAVPSTVKAMATASMQASVQSGLYCNQLSPTYARLLGHVALLCADAGVSPAWDPAVVAAQADRCARAYDKAHYVELVVAHADAGVAPHVETSIHTPDAVFGCRDWAALCALLPHGVPPPSRLHIKSTLDSGGNLAASIGSDDMQHGLAELRREWRAGAMNDADSRRRMFELTRRKVFGNRVLGGLRLTDEFVEAVAEERVRQRSNHAVRLLVQPRLRSPVGSAVPSVGCSFMIDDGGRAIPIAVAQQVFADRDRTKHLGAVVSRGVDAAFSQGDARLGFAALCGLYAADGYRGPIGFDAVLDESGRYVGIFDCNPRLTAVFPALAVQGALRADGAECDSIVNLDYRGLHTWPDALARLDALERAELLYTRQRGRGVLPLPNLARRDSFDLHFVDVSTTEVDEMLKEDLLGPAGDIDKGAVRAVYT